MVNSAVQEVLSCHNPVFASELGTLKGHKIFIAVDPAAQPRFCKAHSVPFAMRLLVEEELYRLVQSGVIEHVKYSNWAAPTRKL